MSDVTCIPDTVLAEMARKQARLDSEIRVLAPDGIDVDKWDAIQDATLDKVAYEDGDLHVWLKTTTLVQEQLASATHWEPAEYRNHDCETHVSIMWSMDPEDGALVDIEVMDP